MDIITFIIVVGLLIVLGLVVARHFHVTLQRIESKVDGAVKGIDGKASSELKAVEKSLPDIHVHIGAPSLPSAPEPAPAVPAAAQPPAP
jgi:hypothetical protein